MECLSSLPDLEGVISWAEDLKDVRQALAMRNGAIVPLITDQRFEDRLFVERHVCIDTTAAGGNASLLAGG